MTIHFKTSSSGLVSNCWGAASLFLLFDRSSLHIHFIASRSARGHSLGLAESFIHEKSELSGPSWVLSSFSSDLSSSYPAKHPSASLRLSPICNKPLVSTFVETFTSCHLKLQTPLRLAVLWLTACQSLTMPRNPLVRNHAPPPTDPASSRTPGYSVCPCYLASSANQECFPGR